jgi:hypothetical protein
VELTMIVIYVLAALTVLVGVGVLWARSLPRMTIRARVYRASAEERATPPAVMAARYADPTYPRQGVWEPGRVVSSQICWPWRAGAVRDVTRSA